MDEAGLQMIPTIYCGLTGKSYRYSYRASFVPLSFAHSGQDSLAETQGAPPVHPSHDGLGALTDRMQEGLQLAAQGFLVGGAHPLGRNLGTPPSPVLETVHLGLSGGEIGGNVRPRRKDAK